MDDRDFIRGLFNEVYTSISRPAQWKVVDGERVETAPASKARSGLCFQIASERLRNDWDLLIAAVEKTNEMIEWLEWPTRRELAVAVRHAGDELQARLAGTASEAAVGMDAVALKRRLVHANGMCLMHLSEEDRNDEVRVWSTSLTLTPSPSPIPYSRCTHHEYLSHSRAHFALTLSLN